MLWHLVNGSERIVLQDVVAKKGFQMMFSDWLSGPTNELILKTGLIVEVPYIVHMDVLRRPHRQYVGRC